MLAKCLTPDQLSPLLDFLINMGGDGYRLGLDLMGMFSHRRSHVLDELMPQIKLAAEKADTRDKDSRSSQMDEHHFQDIMNWVLNKGRENPDACSVALTLTRQLVKMVEEGEEDLIKPLAAQLLSDFPEIAWPLIGQAIVSDTAFRTYQRSSISANAGRCKADPP